MLFSEPKIPQSNNPPRCQTSTSGFSALQRAENSSIWKPIGEGIIASSVSVLFSEPKIPQLCAHHRFDHRNELFQCSSASRKFLNSGGTYTRRSYNCVSVLFSEPKIPQSNCVGTRKPPLARFSALQRAENSSIENARIAYVCTHRVSVLFSEPKIPQFTGFLKVFGAGKVSVLFSEPKIPQFQYT